MSSPGERKRVFAFGSAGAPPWIRLAAGTAVVLAVVVGGVAFDAHLQGGGPGGGTAPAAAVPTPRVSAPSPAPTSGPGTRAFAQVRGLTLSLPASRLVVVAFHEASSDATLALTPLGRCVRDANRYKFRKPPATAGPPYLVMSTRGRPHPATSAVDVAMAPGTAVLAPVSGIVTEVRRYRLYDRYPDLRITLTPTGRPGLRVVVLHVDRLRVRRGDPVTAGVTPLGVPRLFPFRSQVNDYVGAGIPHVHIEVKLLGPSRR